MNEISSFPVNNEITGIPGNIKIVIVEDEQGHYLLVKNCLKQAGFDNKIIWLQDGQAASDFFFHDKSHINESFLLLLDIRLPKMDGTQILENLQKGQMLQRIPTIMLTTSDDDQLAGKCRHLGCQAYVVKPPGKKLIDAIKDISW